MSAEDVARNENADVNRAVVPISGISMPAHLGVGSDLVDGIDYIVWIQVMFDVSSGKKVTPILVWKRLQSRGIRSTKNRDELVGKNTVYESFSRIIEAGYFRRFEKPNEKHPGRKGPIAYEVYDNPSWNPDWQLRQVGSDPLCVPAAPESASEKDQVRMLPGTGEAVDADSASTGKTADQNASRNPGSVVPGSGVPGRGKRRIPAGQNASPAPGRIGPFPPLPPVGGGGSSPYPLHDDARPHPQPEEEVAFNDEEIAAAVAFLQELPDPWEIGEDDARRITPKLLAQMRRKEWPAFPETDHKALTACLTANPGGINNHVSILENKRVPNLPAYRRVEARSTKGMRSTGMPSMPAASEVSTRAASISSILDGLQKPSI